MTQEQKDIATVEKILVEFWPNQFNKNIKTAAGLKWSNLVAHAAVQALTDKGRLQ